MVLLATSNSTAGAELVEAGRDGDVVLKTEESSQGASKVLSTIEQAVVLAKCLDVQRSNPDDELRSKSDSLLLIMH
jgi:hypothetical protein